MAVIAEGFFDTVGGLRDFLDYFEDECPISNGGITAKYSQEPKSLIISARQESKESSGNSHQQMHGGERR